MYKEIGQGFEIVGFILICLIDLRMCGISSKYILLMSVLRERKRKKKNMILTNHTVLWFYHRLT